MNKPRLDGILKQLPTAEADALLAHLEGGTSARAISATLAKHGYGVGKTAINDYRVKRGIGVQL